MKRKVQIGVHPVTDESVFVVGSHVGFQVMDPENFVSLHLDDGSTLRVKSIAAEVLRLEGKYDLEGRPVYHVFYTKVMVLTDCPGHLLKPK